MTPETVVSQGLNAHHDACAVQCAMQTRLDKTRLRQRNLNNYLLRNHPHSSNQHKREATNFDFSRAGHVGNGPQTLIPPDGKADGTDRKGGGMDITRIEDGMLAIAAARDYASYSLVDEQAGQLITLRGKDRP